MKFISSDIVRTYDRKSASLTDTKKMILYFIQRNDFKEAEKYFNIYKLDGGKRTFQSFIKEGK